MLKQMARKPLQLRARRAATPRLGRHRAKVSGVTEARTEVRRRSPKNRAPGSHTTAKAGPAATDQVRGVGVAPAAREFNCGPRLNQLTSPPVIVGRAMRAAGDRCHD